MEVMLKGKNVWGRLIAPLLFAIAIGATLSITPLRVMADNWASGFVRDSNGYLDVNVKAGGGSPSYAVYNMPASTSCVSPAVCVVKNTAGTLHSIVSLTVAGATQPAGTCTWYDNATSASGTVLYEENGMGAGQVVTLDAQALNGVTVQCAAAPGGGGINVETGP